MKNRLSAAAALAIAAAALSVATTGFALGRATAPDPAECLTALDAADATITALAKGNNRISEIDYPTHRTACKEAIG